MLWRVVGGFARKPHPQRANHARPTYKPPKQPRFRVQNLAVLDLPALVQYQAQDHSDSAGIGQPFFGLQIITWKQGSTATGILAPTPDGYLKAR